jgi:hypothetical protein
MSDLLRTLVADEGVRMAVAFLVPTVCGALGYKLGHAEGRRIERNRRNHR